MTNNDVLAGLLAGLAEEERLALAATPDVWRPDGWTNEHGREFLVIADEGIGAPAFAISDESNALHIARQDPARTLRRVNAYRKVLDEHRQANGQCEVCRDYDFHRTYDPVPWPCPTVRALAEIYTETDGVPNAED